MKNMNVPIIIKSVLLSVNRLKPYDKKSATIISIRPEIPESILNTLLHKNANKYDITTTRRIRTIGFLINVKNKGSP